MRSRAGPKRDESNRFDPRRVRDRKRWVPAKEASLQLFFLFRWEISVICPIMVSKVAATEFTSLYFRTCSVISKKFRPWPKRTSVAAVLRTIVDLDRARRLNLCYQVSGAGSQKKETSLLQEMRDRGQGAPGNGRIHLKVSELGKREVVPARLARVRSKLTSLWQTPLYFVKAGRDKDITSNQPIPETPLQSQRGALHPARRSVARSASKRRRKHSLRRMR